VVGGQCARALFDQANAHARAADHRARPHRHRPGLTLKRFASYERFAHPSSRTRCCIRDPGPLGKLRVTEIPDSLGCASASGMTVGRHVRPHRPDSPLRRCSSRRGMISTKLQGGAGCRAGSRGCRPRRPCRRRASPAGRRCRFACATPPQARDWIVEVPTLSIGEHGTPSRSRRSPSRTAA
jgi:hypothetical protein